MPKLSGLALSRLGVVLGCLLFSIGIFLTFGATYLLLVAGIVIAGASLVLIDVDNKKEGRK
jgi:hypothetical protein